MPAETNATYIIKIYLLATWLDWKKFPDYIHVTPASDLWHFNVVQLAAINVLLLQ
jgi:hypothetical protein